MGTLSSDHIINRDCFFHILVTIVLDKMCSHTILTLLEAGKLSRKLGCDVVFGKMLPEYPFGNILRDDHYVSLQVRISATSVSLSAEIYVQMARRVLIEIALPWRRTL